MMQKAKRKFSFEWMSTLKLCALLFFLPIIQGCRSQSLQSGEGYVEVQGGRIWYKVMGSGKGIPLLYIHGGPGSNSCRVIEGLSALSCERPVIVYDQLGSGRSDRPTDSLLWNTDRFASEVVALRKALGLKKLHLIGHSWGGTVLAEYLLTKPIDGIVSAIFSSPLLSTPKWMEDANLLLSRMPKNLQDTIHKYEALKEYKSQSYLDATDSFYARHLSVKPVAANGICDSIPFNEEVYNYMWGPTEFTAVGTLRNYDRTNDLYRIKLPVLFVAGEHDEARPETMYFFQQRIIGSKVAVIPGAAHRTIGDNRDAYLQAISKFLKSVESGKP